MSTGQENSKSEKHRALRDVIRKLTTAAKIANADARGNSWLARGNEHAEKGEKQKAERCFAKGQHWLDRSNKLRGNF